MKKIIFAVAVLSMVACNNSTEEKTSTPTKEGNAYSTEGRSVKVYTTAKDTELRLSLTGRDLKFVPKGQPAEDLVCVFVDPSRSFQAYLGIGGALTDASAETFYKLPKEKQQEILKAYFDKEQGIGYTLARTNIHSCDFSSGSYTYVDSNDVELKSFTLDHDRQYKIPFIKEAQAAAGGKLTLYASPWSPPA